MDRKEEKRRRREKKRKRDIFFFKQKTAYEIYQCDWSSDVCSSDLVFPQHNHIYGPCDDAGGSRIEVYFRYFPEDEKCQNSRENELGEVNQGDDL